MPPGGRAQRGGAGRASGGHQQGCAAQFRDQETATSKFEHGMILYRARKVDEKFEVKISIERQLSHEEIVQAIRADPKVSSRQTRSQETGRTACTIFTLILPGRTSSRTAATCACAGTAGEGTSNSVSLPSIRILARLPSTRSRQRTVRATSPLWLEADPGSPAVVRQEGRESALLPGAH